MQLFEKLCFFFAVSAAKTFIFSSCLILNDSCYLSSKTVQKVSSSQVLAPIIKIFFFLYQNVIKSREKNVSLHLFVYYIWK